jgi:hypothetical protein
MIWLADGHPRPVQPADVHDSFRMKSQIPQAIADVPVLPFVGILAEGRPDQKTGQQATSWLISIDDSFGLKSSMIVASTQ